MKTTLDKANKAYHFELFNNIVNNFSGKNFTTDDLMQEFFGIKNFTPKDVKKVKDKDLPKRPNSAYFIFSNEKRPSLMEKSKKDNGGKVNVTDVSKELGKMWGNLNDKKRKPYEEKALKDKGRYEKEMAEYKAKKQAEAESE
tara:strand:- start:159 stop:584 length:426 start_codon:yes stop_codon:yes gene_type:complete